MPVSTTATTSGFGNFPTVDTADVVTSGFGQFAKVLVSKSIFKGHGNINQVKITIPSITGDFQLRMTADADSATPTWDIVSLGAGESWSLGKTHTFSVPGDDVKYWIAGVGVLSSTQDANGQWTPALRIQKVS